MSEAFIRLRGHHLICLLSFVGKGYGRAFVENFVGVAKEISAGQNNIQIVDCADDICRAPNKEPCRQAEACQRRGDEILRADELALSLINQSAIVFPLLQPFTSLQFSHRIVQQLREAMASGKFLPLCSPCPWWEGVCKSVVENKFKDVILYPSRSGDGSLKKDSFSLWSFPKQS